MLDLINAIPRNLILPPASLFLSIGAGLLLSLRWPRAWDLAERWPDREPTKRVWLHTCSLDGPHAMANYERRGFRLFDTKVEEVEETETPGPWPGADV